jgi:hypothetical protein
VVVFGGWWYRDELVARGVQSDLAGYLRTFDHYQAGGDPYDDPDFLYTPVFVVAGNAAYQALGPRAFVLAFRAGALLGVWVLVWLSLRPVRWPWPAQVVAAAMVVPSGLTDNGIHCANLTLLLAAPLMLGLLVSERHPLVGGALAGSVNVIKPLGVTALAVAVTPERGRSLPRREQLLAAGAAALAIVLWLLLVRRELLPEMLGRVHGKPEEGHHLAIHRALYQLGIHVPAVVVFLVVTALGCAIAWRYAVTIEQRTAIGLAFSAMALPVVNPNTLLSSVPIQALALDRAALRWQAASERSWRSVAELAIVGAAVIGVHGALGTVAFHDLPWPTGGLVTLIPHLEIAFLALYASSPGRDVRSATV